MQEFFTRLWVGIVALFQFFTVSVTFNIAETPQVEGEITVMSSNIRCITPSDTGERSWVNRAGLIVQNIENNAPDVIGFQEVMPLQYSYLKKALKGYGSVIKYRDMTPFFSEGCPVFYRADKYKLLDKGSFWLSETPDRMSRDWDSACYRICSYVILEEKASGREFAVFNTHLDHVSNEARINGIQVVLDKIADFGGLPSILMGDFNAGVTSETYLMAAEHFLDAQVEAADTMDSSTFNGWGPSIGGGRIDYILYSKTGLQAEKYWVETSTYDGAYPSDHFPVCAKLSFAD